MHRVLFLIHIVVANMAHDSVSSVGLIYLLVYI